MPAPASPTPSGHAPAARRDPVPLALSAAAFVLYVWSAAPGAYWLDSGELAASAASLGVPHPPGHPSWMLPSHAATWLPLGSLAFRVSLLSAAAGAACVSLVYLLARELVSRAAGAADVPHDRATATACAIAFAVSDAHWLQAVRPEVYSLHLAMVLGLVLGALRWRGGRAELAGLGFLLGLSGGNHHLLALATAPSLAVLWLARRRVQAQLRAAVVTRDLVALTGAALAGLAAYAALPLRAATVPLVDYGAPDTLERFLAVLTAQAFQSSVGGASTPLGVNLDSAWLMTDRALGAFWPLAALGGLVWLAHRRHAAVAMALALALVANLATKVLMDLDPNNPDAAGYLQLTFALVAACAAPAFLPGRSAPTPLRHAGAAALTASLLLAAAHLPAAATRAGLARHVDATAWDAETVRGLPPGSVLLTSHYAHHFNRLHHRAAESHRPDVVALHQGFDRHIDGGAPLARRVRGYAPGASPLVDAALSSDAFPTDAVVSAASRRPVALEPTLSVPIPRHTLRPTTQSLMLLPAPVTEAAIAEARQDAQQALTRTLGPLPWPPETRKTVLLAQLKLAVVHLQQGAPAAAAAALSLADAASPGQPYSALLAPVLAAYQRADAAGTDDARRAVRAAAAAADYRGLFFGESPRLPAPR